MLMFLLKLKVISRLSDPNLYWLHWLFDTGYSSTTKLKRQIPSKNCICLTAPVYN